MTKRTNQSIASRLHSAGRRLSLSAALAMITIVFSQRQAAGEWMTWQSTYTHSCTGCRVDQHTPPVEPMGPNRTDVVRSGYRHFRSTLQAGQSADNYHVTEQWGAPVVPYEHWRFPYRPYGVPYDAWGPPTPYGMFFGSGLGFGFPMPPGPVGGGSGHGGGPGWSGPGWGFGPSGWQAPWGGGNPQGFPLQPNYQNQPWFDGTYPDAPPLNTMPDRQFFWKPSN
ncbi:MAG: hypothetical protein KF752_02235 [Pirellulaceae bacterium]|nr:hypothetical protein [Pirellulaceae bacterium]